MQTAFKNKTNCEVLRLRKNKKTGAQLLHFITQYLASICLGLFAFFQNVQKYNLVAYGTKIQTGKNILQRGGLYKSIVSYEKTAL